MSNIDSLRALADVCHKTCSDYSCVRRGECGGNAGHDYRRELHRLKEMEKQNEADRELAAQINRLKKAGLI